MAPKLIARGLNNLIFNEFPRSSHGAMIASS
jgi:hypothetical protein